MPLKFQNTSSGGGGGESLAETLVIGNTTGPRDIIQTDGKVFRCNDENGLQFASTSGETHTNGGTTFTTLFNTNQFNIRDLAAKALFFIRSLSSKLYLKIGDATLGNGAVFVVDDDNNRSYTDNVAHDIKVGINNAAPSVALEVVGDVLINNNVYANGFFRLLESSGVFSLGDFQGDVNNTSINGNDDNQTITYFALLGHVFYGKVRLNSLQDFANNAAAITGGLVAGDLYYTNSGGSAVIKIVV